MLGTPLGTSWSVLMNEYYHKKYHYIWLRCWDQYGFRDINPFMKIRGWGVA